MRAILQSSVASNRASRTRAKLRSAHERRLIVPLVANFRAPLLVRHNWWCQIGRLASGASCRANAHEPPRARPKRRQEAHANIMMLACALSWRPIGRARSGPINLGARRPANECRPAPISRLGRPFRAPTNEPAQPSVFGRPAGRSLEFMPASLHSYTRHLASRARTRLPTARRVRADATPNGGCARQLAAGQLVAQSPARIGRANEQLERPESGASNRRAQT